MGRLWLRPLHDLGGEDLDARALLPRSGRESGLPAELVESPLGGPSRGGSGAGQEERPASPLLHEDPEIPARNPGRTVDLHARSDDFDPDEDGAEIVFRHGQKAWVPRRSAAGEQDHLLVEWSRRINLPLVPPRLGPLQQRHETAAG